MGKYAIDDGVTIKGVVVTSPVKLKHPVRRGARGRRVLRHRRIPAVVTSAEVATGGAKAENYEGVLVQVKNAKVTAALDMNAEFIVDMKHPVDDAFFAKADWVNPKIGDIYTTITGPLAYTFDNFKGAPRTIADLVK